MTYTHLGVSITSYYESNNEAVFYLPGAEGASVEVTFEACRFPGAWCQITRWNRVNRTWGNRYVPETISAKSPLALD